MSEKITQRGLMCKLKIPNKRCRLSAEFPAGLFIGAILILAVFLESCQSSSSALPVTILHWNDFHAQNTPFDKIIDGDTLEVGGAAYLAAVLDSLRACQPRAIALHAGDEFTGTAICAITKGQSQIEILDAIRPDAFELGNHEFDYGWENLREKLRAANFGVLCCNVVDSASALPIVTPALIIERDGVRLAIIGVISSGLYGSVIKGALAGLRVMDPIPIVNQLLDDLEPVSDIQVALTHQGIEEDKVLARACPRLELIVGGHQHVRFFSPLVENGVPILQAGCKGEYVGVFRAMVDTAANRLVSYNEQLLPVATESIRPREDITALVEAHEKAISVELDRVVGVLTLPWIRRDDRESNVGNWTCDAMVRLTGCDVAFMNPGGLRKDLPAGPVTVRDLWELHPFNNTLMEFEMSGEKLIEGMSFHSKGARRLLQIGGMRYRADKKTGEILEISVGGKPVQPMRSYSVVSNEFVIGHLQSFLGFSLDENEITETGWIDRELIQKAFELEGKVASRVDGRITLE